MWLYLCGMNYFELYGIQEAPVVDRRGLAKKYFDLQKKYHPDFYTQATEAEREEALRLSALVNQAFRVFSNDDATLAYFLECRGHLSHDEKFTLPPDFLMEMMELNEELAEKGREEVEGKIESLEASLKTEVEGYLRPEALPSLDERALSDLKMYYFKKKYISRILDRLPD